MVQMPVDHWGVGPSPLEHTYGCHPSWSRTLPHTSVVLWLRNILLPPLCLFKSVPFGLFYNFCFMVGRYIWPLRPQRWPGSCVAGRNVYFLTPSFPFQMQPRQDRGRYSPRSLVPSCHFVRSNSGVSCHSCPCATAWYLTNHTRWRPRMLHLHFLSDLRLSSESTIEQINCIFIRRAG